MDLSELLTAAAQVGASDLHLSAGMPPLLRVHGELQRLTHPVLTHQEVRERVMALLAPRQQARYEAELEIDFAFALDGVGRFRVNAYHQLHGAAAVFRLVPTQVLTLAALRAPPIFAELALRPRGLVLVTGPTGSGKSTTLAALVDHRNALRSDHILTIEDPIEFVHVSNKSLITQRELGGHSHTFANALRAALREDPDVILVGELRDAETIRLALTAAETGHLVLGTLHTGSAAKAVDRIIDVFPAQEKEQARSMLAESLEAVIAQVLLKTGNAAGRCACYEVMLATPAIRHLIRDNKVAQMTSILQTGAALGMQTLDQGLATLLRDGHIERHTARTVARYPDAFAE